MAVLTSNKERIKKIIGNVSDEKIDDKLSMFGAGVEAMRKDEIDVEITPNRPDLLSQQGFERALISFFKKPNIKKYKAEKSKSSKSEKDTKDYKVIIDKSVKKTRPFTACAIVKGLKLDNEKIKELIDIQEKLHQTYGRDRKKLAIGIYPLEAIKLPIKYLAKKPEDIKFIPLESAREMTGRQILSGHPAGRDYAHLLKDVEVFPVFQDAAGEILSMPPIINSQKTGKISEKTKEVFIECSGFNLEYLKKALNIIACAIDDMGGKIYEMKIEDSTSGSWTSPDFEPEKMPFSVENINKTLGLALSEKEIKKLLEKMNITCEKTGKSTALTAIIPPYRTDILHEIDLSEEVAIAYGYDKLEPEIPSISTIGQEDKTAILKQKIAKALVGLGLLEISTYHLSTKETQFKKMGVREFKTENFIKVANSRTENNILRTSLLANSIQILSQNSDASYPQKVFELGKVFYNDPGTETQIGESEHLCISLCYEKANFTELKQIFDYLMRMLGKAGKSERDKDKAYEIKETEATSFIKGRCGKILINGKEAGLIGEISPTALKNSKIKVPVISLEISINELTNNSQ